MMMYEKKKGELAMTQAGLLCRDSWTWQHVAALQRLLPMASSRMHCGLMQRRLGHCDLTAMQEFTGWCILQGLDVTEGTSASLQAGPCFALQRHLGAAPPC